MITLRTLLTVIGIAATFSAAEAKSIPSSADLLTWPQTLAALQPATNP
jgi:hypothetical protein